MYISIYSCVFIKYMGTPHQIGEIAALLKGKIHELKKNIKKKKEKSNNSDLFPSFTRLFIFIQRWFNWRKVTVETFIKVTFSPKHTEINGL